MNEKATTLRRSGRNTKTLRTILGDPCIEGEGGRGCESAPRTVLKGGTTRQNEVCQAGLCKGKKA